MVVITIVSLFTARITLRVLGVEDYGVYNVVGGIIGFLTFLTGTMTSATQRFLAFELGKNNFERFNQIFSMLILIFLIISMAILLIGSSVGLWLVNNVLVIPKDRLLAANWVMIFSILTFISNMVTIPYMSAIISHERMSIYAYMSLLDTVMKLLLVYLLYISPVDKLISYAFLTMLSTIIITFIYRLYCSRKLRGCTFHYYWDTTIFKDILGYTGWNLFGSVTTVLNQQGLTLVLNLFFGPVVNAAKAIADRINNMVISFSNNFYMAVTPQIIKSYSAGEKEEMRNLVCKSTKFSYYLLLVLALPLICNMQSILVIWLGSEVVTRDTIIFSQFILVFSLVNILEQPLTMMIRATGQIRNYQIFVGLITFLSLPITYIVFKCHKPAYSCLLVLISVYIVAHFIRLYICKKQVDFSILKYLKQSIIPIVAVTGLSLCLIFSFLRILQLPWYLNLFVEIIGIMLSIYFCGLTKHEKVQLLSMVKKKVYKRK